MESSMGQAVYTNLRYHPNYDKCRHSLHILSYVRFVTGISVAPKAYLLSVCPRESIRKRMYHRLYT